MIVTMTHLRQNGMCSKGARRFADQHGFNWSVFLREGIDSEVLRKTNDGMALEAIAYAEKEGK